MSSNFKSFKKKIEMDFQRRRKSINNNKTIQLKMNSTNNNTLINLKMKKLIIEEDTDDEGVEIVEAENKLKALKERKALKDAVQSYRNIRIPRKIEEIRRLKELLEEAEMDLDALENLDDDELASTREIKVYVCPTVETQPRVKKIGSTRGTPTKYDRVADWLKIVDGTELTIFYNGKRMAFTKVNGSLVHKGITYPTMRNAGKAFYVECGLPKERSLNAWVEFKVVSGGKFVPVGEFVRNI
jgi:hypothetical protein